MAFPHSPTTTPTPFVKRVVVPSVKECYYQSDILVSKMHMRNYEMVASFQPRVQTKSNSRAAEVVHSPPIYGACGCGVSSRRPLLVLHAYVRLHMDKYYTRASIQSRVYNT